MSYGGELWSSLLLLLLSFFRYDTTEPHKRLVQYTFVNELSPESCCNVFLLDFQLINKRIVVLWLDMELRNRWTVAVEGSEWNQLAVLLLGRGSFARL